MTNPLLNEQIKGLEFGRPLDTTPDAWEVYWRSLRGMSDERRLQMGIEMSNWGRARCEEAVRHRHPEYDDDEVRRAVLLLMQGRDIYRMVFPDRDIAP